MFKIKKGIVGLASLLLIPGCKLDYLIGPPIPMGSVQISPVPEKYFELWNYMEGCSGRERDINEVSFWIFPESVKYLYCPNKEKGCAGLHSSYWNRIYVVRPDSVMDVNPPEYTYEYTYILGHEMLHALGFHHEEDPEEGIFGKCQAPRLIITIIKP